MKTMCKLIMAVIVVLFVAQANASTTGAQLTGVVNINTATQNELMLLPGIGETRAVAILEQRGPNGFAAVDELLAVKGIGEQMLEKIAPFCVTKGATTLKEVKVTEPKTAESKPVPTTNTAQPAK